MKIFKSTCLNIHMKHLTFSYLVGKPFFKQRISSQRGLLIAAQDMHSFYLNTDLYKVLMILKSHAWMAWEQQQGFFCFLGAFRVGVPCLASGECNLSLSYLFQTKVDVVPNFYSMLKKFLRPCNVISLTLIPSFLTFRFKYWSV